jgi:hypothetical protein
MKILDRRDLLIFAFGLVTFFSRSVWSGGGDICVYTRSYDRLALSLTSVLVDGMPTTATGVGIAPLQSIESTSTYYNGSTDDLHAIVRFNAPVSSMDTQTLFLARQP